MDLFKNRKPPLSNERAHKKTRFKIAVGTLSATLLFLVMPTIGASASPGLFGNHGWRGDGHPGSNRSGTVVTLESSPYGPVLVVGGSGAATTQRHRTRTLRAISIPRVRRSTRRQQISPRSSRDSSDFRT